jgi:biotin carboxyl carrier protein
MYRAVVNNGNSYEISQEGNQPVINNEKLAWDISSLDNGQLHILHNHKSYTAELVSVNKEEKTVTVKLNGQKFTVSIKDRHDLLLEELGMADLATSKVNDLKAPMPGLMLSINVSVGQEVSKGEPLLILEAMKMENVIKSPTDGTIQQILVKQGQSVEKNQVLIQF